MSNLDAKDRAESAILGSILLDPRLLYECGGMRPEYFANGDHAKIFSRMMELDAAGKPIDTVTLGDAGVSTSALSDIEMGSMERPSIQAYVDIVCDAAKRRYFKVACDNVLAKIDDPEIDTTALLSSQEELILRLLAAGTAKNAVHVKEVVPNVLNELSAQRRHRDALIGLTTGITSIDNLTTGIRPGEYWVIGAPPSRGKTVLGAQMVASNASQGIPCMAFTYEMTREQFVKRMLPNQSKVDAQTIRDFRFSNDEDEKKVENAGAEIAQWPFWVCDPEGMTAQELVAVAKLHIRRHGVKLVVVDYLQIIQGPGDIRTRVGAVSNALRALAKSEKVAVVALSQLRRPADEDDRPTMFHLKETGDIEAHAHAILLLYRPKGGDAGWTGKDELIIAKQREGVVGSEPVVLNDSRLWFVTREPE